MNVDLIEGVTGTFIVVSMGPTEAKQFLGIAEFIKSEATEDKIETMKQFEGKLSAILGVKKAKD